MRLDFEMTGNILIAKAAGEIDHHTASYMREEIDKTFGAFMAQNLILDFSKVTFMDSSGIGVVMGRYNKVKEKEGKIFITACSQYMNKILDMAGIFTIVPLHRTIEEAVDAIEGILTTQIEMEVVSNDK